jgi:hypothetical protein
MYYNIFAQIEICISHEIEYLSDSIVVSVELENNTKSTVYISKGGFGGDFLEDSLLLIDFGYFENISDPLLIPHFRLKFIKLRYGDKWLIKKGKKTKNLKKIHVRFDTFTLENQLNRSTKKRLNKGFMFMDEFFNENFKVQTVNKIIEL